jgi:hypothetical protein
MKKVSELTGSDLDYWVARAEGLKKGQSNWVAYSSKWSVGGPIIEREKICIKPRISASSSWYAEVSIETKQDYVFETGETPLIAAMRCYVASKFGEEVDDSQKT